MATLIPASPKDCPNGERLVYEKLGRELDNDWIILHSLGLPSHPHKIWGEADIVILSTKGFFALEVKGGKVSCKDGVWQFGEPGGKGYTKKEDPWTQAKGSMFAVRDRLVAGDQLFEEVLIGYGVVMPMETFTTTGAEIDPAVLLDHRHFPRNFGFYIGDLQRHWAEAYRSKHGRVPRTPTRDEIRLARRILRPDVDSAFSIGSYLNGVDAQLLQLSNDQIRATRRMASNPRTVVRGKAGTGKTIIAVERALSLAVDGSRVLYLCFNRLLADHLRISVARDERSKLVDFRHVHAFYREFIAKAGMLDRLDSLAQDDPLLYAEKFPRIFVEAVIEQGIDPWDALVVDEAQDLLTADNLDAFDLVLRYGINQGCWHIFFDPRQNIYGADLEAAFERRLAEARPTYDDLFENCRNTRQVATQASIVSGIDLALFGAIEGMNCENVYYSDPKHAATRLEQVVAGLLSRDVRPEDIAILSTRRRENSLVAGIDTVAGVPIANAEYANGRAILFSTIHAFKGLERLVVLVTDMEEIGQEKWSMLHYAGLSRARGLLQVFMPESVRPAYGRQAEAFATRMQG